MPDDTYRGYPDLDIAAGAAQRHRALARWYDLRHTDITGRGVATITADCVRTAGAGIFWTMVGDRAYLHSPARVARALGVRRFLATYVASTRRLRGRPGRVRAWLGVNAIATLRRGQPTLVKLAAAQLGVTPRTLRRWVRLLRWPRQARYERTLRLPGRPKWGSTIPETFALRHGGEFFAAVQRASVWGTRSRVVRGRTVRRLQRRLHLLTIRATGNGPQPFTPSVLPYPTTRSRSAPSPPHPR